MILENSGNVHDSSFGRLYTPFCFNIGKGSLLLSTDPSSHLNEKVVLVGVAENAKLAPCVLLSDGSSIYIKDLNHWDEGLMKKKIKVTGVLRKREYSDPLVNNKGEYSAGMDGIAWFLEAATWEEV